MKPGIYHSLSFDEYQAIEAVGGSKFSKLKRSPAHYKTALDEPDKDTPALVFGRAFHACVLQGDTFNEMYAGYTEDVSFATTAGKTLKANMEATHPGKTIFKKPEWDSLWAMAEAIWSHPTASKLLHDTGREVTIVWEDRETGLLCKGRLDAWSEQHKVIIDLKTTTNASEYAFKQDAVDRSYINQLAWYQTGLFELGEPAEDCVMIAVEKEPPYGIMVYSVEDDALRLSALENAELLKRVKCCTELNQWPCYPSMPMSLGLVEWNRKHLETKYGPQQFSETVNGSSEAGTNGVVL